MQVSSYEISHGDVKHSRGNIVNNIVVTVDGVRGYQIYRGDHFLSYVMSNHCVVHLKVIEYCMPTVDETLNKLQKLNLLMMDITSSARHCLHIKLLKFCHYLCKESIIAPTYE